MQGRSKGVAVARERERNEVIVNSWEPRKENAGRKHEGSTLEMLLGNRSTGTENCPLGGSTWRSLETLVRIIVLQYWE